MLPDASESQKQELRTLLLLVVPPLPFYPAWLQNMETDRASLDSPVYVPASDASPPDKISQPIPLQLLRVHARLTVCKLFN